MGELLFDEWFPDQPAHRNPGAIQAKNCLPRLNSYEQFNSLAPYTATPLTTRARGTFWLRASNGAVFNFAGDEAKLYLFGSDTYDNVSKPATSYAALNWDFVNFQNRVLATDGSSAVQYFDCGVSATFDNLPGNPPNAAVIGVIRDFVMLGDYQIGSEIEPGGLAWCGFNNTELWTPSLSTQAGRRRTRGPGGKVQRIVSGTSGLVMRENALMMVSYVGAPNVFQFDDLTTLHGTPAPRSVCWTQDVAFYYSQEGFMQIDRNTRQITPIGVFKVDEWFRQEAAAIDIVSMQGNLDRKRKLVYWAFRSSGSSPSFDRILVYNWAAQRWAYAELAVEWLGEFVSTGYNLDTIGALLGGDIDSASINVDTDAYTGGALSLIGFNPSHIAGTFDGTPLTAELDTSEQEVAEDKRGMVNGVRPLVEGVGASVIQIAPITRNRVQDNPMTGTFGPVNAIGQVDLRVNARYHRYRVRIAGGFTHAKGVQFSMKTRGRR